MRASNSKDLAFVGKKVESKPNLKGAKTTIVSGWFFLRTLGAVGMASSIAGVAMPPVVARLC